MFDNLGATDSFASLGLVSAAWFSVELGNERRLNIQRSLTGAKLHDDSHHLVRICIMFVSYGTVVVAAVRIRRGSGFKNRGAFCAAVLVYVVDSMGEASAWKSLLA